MFGRGRCRWQPAALFLLAALCSCGLWYAKNWALAGNPVYPLVFGGVSRTPERIEQWNRAHRVPPDEFGRRYSAPQAIAAAADFGWRNLWQSPLLVPFAAAAFLGTRHRRLVLLLAAYAGFYLAVWWLATHRVDRFWVPILPWWRCWPASAPSGRIRESGAGPCLRCCLAAWRQICCSCRQPAFTTTGTWCRWNNCGATSPRNRTALRACSPPIVT